MTQSSGSYQEAASLASGLVRCTMDEDWDAWQGLWESSGSPALTAAALSGLCRHLLTRVAELTGGQRDEILQEFAILAALNRATGQPPS